MLKDKSTLISAIVLFFIYLYGFLYLMIYIKAEEQDFKTFEVVTGLLGLLLSSIAAIFVYNAYQAQREQIGIQKQEIEDNKVDVEHNRVIDVFYKQLEFSLKNIKQNGMDEKLKKFILLNQKCDLFDSTEYNIINEINSLRTIISLFNFLSIELRVYSNIIEKTKITLEVKKDLIELIVNNICPNLYEALYSYQFILADADRKMNFSSKVPRHDEITSQNHLESLYRTVSLNYAMLVGYIFIDIVPIELIYGDD